MESTSPVTSLDLVAHVGRGGQQVQAELPLQPLPDDLHVQQPQEPAAEAEAQSLGRLGLVVERRVVELELLQRVAQLGVVLPVDGEQPAEHHGRDVAIAGQRLGSRPTAAGEGVAHPQVGHLFDARG